MNDASDYIPTDRPRGTAKRITLRLEAVDLEQLERAVALNRKRAGGDRFLWPPPADLSTLCRRWIRDGLAAFLNGKRAR